MALIKTSNTNIADNSNNTQERLKLQNQENLDFIPVVHVKGVYKSFNYKNNKNNSSSITTPYDHLSGATTTTTTQLSKKFESSSSHDVLNGVDLKIKEGEFVTIVGPSGCGKSTLLNIIAGLDRPDSGSVRIRGHLANSNTSSTKRIMIFQEGALFPWLNVQDNVEFGLKIAKMPKDMSRQGR